MYQGILPTDRSLVPLSTAFIGCYNGWFPFFNAGACTIFMEHFDLAEVPKLVREERATHVFLTPTLWRRILNAEDAGENFRSVRLIGFAAEPMDAATLKRLRERISPNIVQVYGSTEIGAAATCISADEMLGERLISVGRPLVNSDIRVVTPGGKPDQSVPTGQVGEVLISSPSLAAEIWADPEATTAAFVVEGNRRWWRSRDLGRLDADGYLYLEGRRDDMIISGGINIMPARVEDVLLAHPGVAECAVVGVPSAEWGEEVQAFIVGRDPKLDAAAIDVHVRGSELSPYQRPRVYHFVGELPRTSTNKVLRRTLRETALGLRSVKSETTTTPSTGKI
jgi:fatty-acyl-CoA synthase